MSPTPHEQQLPRIVSYPGAQLEPCIYIFTNKTSTQVKHVILSFRLNIREQVNQVHLGKTIQQLLGDTSSTFPNAMTHIPLINSDKSLPAKSTDNLKFINDKLELTGHSIPLLLGESFRFQEDKIHWSPVTGKAMATHWLKHLN